MQIARSWRQQTSNLKLIGSQCPKCGALFFPERIRCPNCASNDFVEFRFSGDGKVMTHSTALEAPLGFEEQIPYISAIIQLNEGPLVAAMLTDLDDDEVKPGMEVTMVTRRISASGAKGPIVYAYKFAPKL